MKPAPSRSRRRADRIRATVSMARILADYGYPINPDGGDREQQYPCDLHGDGRDGKASGRLYPTSNSTYCFACGRARDGVAFTMEKEGLKFNEALDKIERRYALPPLPHSVEDEGDDSESIESMLAEKPASFEDESKRTEKFLRTITRNRALDMIVTLQLWAEFDRIQHGVSHESWADARGAAAMAVLRASASNHMGAAYTCATGSGDST